MRAIRMYDYGHSDQLLLDEVERPVARAGEVLVRIHDAGVNPIDWKLREGLVPTPAPLEFPVTVGQDFAGEIIDVGPGVRDFKIMDEVYGFATGAYAELACASAKEIARKPRSLDYATAASIPTAGLTAWQCLVDIAKIRKGQTVLIHGAGGGVGAFAAQIAIARGARVVATASKDDKKYLTHIGVDRVLDYHTDKFEERFHDVDVVLDLIGGEIQKKSLRVLKRGGCIVSTVGGLDSAELKSLGFNGQSMMMNRDGHGLSELARLVDQGELAPRVSCVFDLEDAPKALDLLQNGHPHGKIVLRI